MEECAEDDDDDMEEICEWLFNDDKDVVAPAQTQRQTNAARSLSAQLGLQPNKAIPPDEAVTWRPT